MKWCVEKKKVHAFNNPLLRCEVSFYDREAHVYQMLLLCVQLDSALMEKFQSLKYLERLSFKSTV